MDKNTGIIFEARKEGDYIYGSAFAAAIKRTVFSWVSALPLGEAQRSNKDDFMDCVTFSGPTHTIEAQVNYDLAKGNYKQEAIDYFNEAGYMEDGKFRVSARYLAKTNGTTMSGQYMSVAGEAIRSHDKKPELGFGLLPNKDWAMTSEMVWADYYAEIPQVLIDKARKIYEYIQIQYNWVNAQDIPDALLNAPVQIATAFCAGWHTDSVVKACNQPCQHCIMVYGIDEKGNYLIVDQYNPFLKKLAPNFQIYAAMQYVATPLFPPNLFQKLLAKIKAGAPLSELLKLK